MKLSRIWIGFSLVALLAGCSSEGGVVGTGISSSVSGNIATVDVSASATVSAAAPAAIPFPIRVSLAEAPDVSDTADSDGNFILEGDFAGPLTLLFSGPHGVIGRLGVDVPAGADIVLEDIAIRSQQNGGVQAGKIRQHNFYGRILSVDCAQSTLEIGDDLSRLFRVQLGPSTAIINGPDGAALACTDLRPGIPVLIDAVLQGGPPIQAVQVTVRPGPRGGPKSP
jgi:hypothetical protein